MKAKTTILEELEIPEERKAALSREALRQGIPLNQLLKKILLLPAERVLAAAAMEQKAA